MSGPHHIGKYPIEIQKGVDLSQMASARIAALEKALRAIVSMTDSTLMHDSEIVGDIRVMAFEALNAPVGQQRDPS